MQTFLPYPDYKLSASVLDRSRLGKQRVECKQIVTALVYSSIGVSAGWQRHPATLMWTGHIGSLCEYAIEVCQEWTRRGYYDSLRPFFEHYIKVYPTTKPKWLGDERLHSSHRSKLLFKDREWYSQFGWTDNTLDYWWPNDN